MARIIMNNISFFILFRIFALSSRTSMQEYPMTLKMLTPKKIIPMFKLTREDSKVPMEFIRKP